MVLGYIRYNTVLSSSQVMSIYLYLKQRHARSGAHVHLRALFFSPLKLMLQIVRQ
jgi:hypothetical protein